MREFVYRLLPMKTTRRKFLRTGGALAAGALILPTARARGEGPRRIAVDVCIYGGTSGGVMAAVALAGMGRSVAIIEPTRHLGGMTSSGLGWIDIAQGETSYGGLTRRCIGQLKQANAAAGRDPANAQNQGWVCEPHVAEMLFEQWMSERRIEVVREARLAGVKKDGRRLHSATFDFIKPFTMILSPVQNSREARNVVDPSYPFWRSGWAASFDWA